VFKREVAVVMLGAITEGVTCIADLISSALPFVLDALTSENNVLRDSATWTLSKQKIERQ
jgi:hypothetical protein